MLDPARCTMSAMLASAKPRSVNTCRAASSSARCVCAVRLHCQAPPAGPSFGNLGMNLLLTGTPAHLEANSRKAFC